MIESIPRWMAAPLLSAAVVTAVPAEVRVFFDLETFRTETGASQITADYPAGFRGESFTSGSVTFTRSGGGLFFSEWTPALPGTDLAISGVENFDMSFAVPYLHAVGIEVIEPTCGSCVNSTFEVIVFGNADVSSLAAQAELHRETIDFPDDEAAFIGFASDRRIARVAIREIVGTDDNEYFGHVHGSVHRPASVPPGTDVRVLEFNQPIEFPIPFDRGFDFGRLPLSGLYRAVHDDGLEVIASGQQPWIHVDGSPLGTRAARQPDAFEQWTLSLPPGTHAVEFEFYESSLAGTAANSCFNATCFDTRYRLRAWNGPDLIRDQQFSAWNDRVNRYALWSNVPIDRLELQGVFNNSDDELLGRVRVGDEPLPPSFPERVASVDGPNFGRQVAVDGDFAVTADRSGFSTWKRDGGTWHRQGWRALDVEPERVAVDDAQVVIARRNGSGGLLAIFRRNGEPPDAWSSPTEFAYSGAARSLALDNDVIALGLAGRVRLFEHTGADAWQAAGDLLPPGGGNNAFGLGVGLDGDLLVVGAGDDTFHVYRRGTDGRFTEEFHQSSPTSPGTSIVDVSVDRIAQQGFSGAVRLYEPAPGGGWVVVETLGAPLPFVPSGGLGSGVDLDDDALLLRKSFFDAGASDFRQAVALWQRIGGRWMRSYVLADPHLAGDRSANLGGLGVGDAMSLSGDAFWLGHPGSPWCVGTSNAFFGDNGALGYRESACGSRSGAAFIGSLIAIDAPLFLDGFESLP